MSIKTLRKRIALVSVAALGFGLLTVNPTVAANNAAVGGNNASAAAGILNVATKAATLGDAVTSATVADLRSLGLLANSTSLDTNSLTSTATISSTGEIVFYTLTPAASSTDSFVSIEVSGGTINEYVGDNVGSGEVLLNQTNTLIVNGKDEDGSDNISVGILPNSGVASMTVSLYTNTLTSAEDTANGMATALTEVIAGTRSKGTLSQRYVVTVATTSVSGVYSAADSFIQGQACNSLAAPTTNVETSSAHLNIVNAATAVACISIDLRDAYNVSLDSKGALIVSGTNGAGIAYETSYAAATSITNLTDVDTDTSGTITVARPAAFANKNFSTTVTVSWNGAVVGTKTVNFLGEVAKLTAAVDYVGRAGTSTPAAIGYVVASDSAGNTVYVSSGIQVTATTLNTAVTAVSFSDWSDSGTLDTKSDFDATCGGTAATGRNAGSATVTFTYTNPLSGSVITSNAVKISCGGDAATYTASFDKATYAPGEVATLTITGKDAAGNLTNAVTDYVGTGATLMTINGGGQLTLVGAAPVAGTAEKFNAGPGIMVKRFTVGSTEGSYNAIVSIPVSNAYDLGGKDVIVGYQVKSASTAVSNAEVLAAIVKLIASINKQIRALQKSLRR